MKKRVITKNLSNLFHLTCPSLPLQAYLPPHIINQTLSLARSPTSKSLPSSPPSLHQPSLTQPIFMTFRDRYSAKDLAANGTLKTETGLWKFPPLTFFPNNISPDTSTFLQLGRSIKPSGHTIAELLHARMATTRQAASDFLEVRSLRQDVGGWRFLRKVRHGALPLSRLLFLPSSTGTI